MGKKRVIKTAAPPEPIARQRTGQNLNVWLPHDIMDAFEQMLARTRRTKTAEVLVMMEAYLKDAGLWPPKPGE